MALPGLKAHWTKLAQLSVWVTCIVFTFLAAPPRESPAHDADTWISMVQFVLAIVLGLIVGLAGKRRQPKSRWMIASALCLLLGLAGFFANKTAIASWTCEYDGRGPMIIGKTMTAEGATYLRADPRASCTQLLQDSAGNNRIIWVPSEIGNRHSVLVALFLGTVLAFSLSAVLMLESLSAAATPRRTR